MSLNRFLTGWGTLATALILLGTFAPNPATAQQGDQTHKTIQGGVSHDVKLPGLPDEFHVGKKFDETNLQALTPANYWMPIPEWYAGKWHSEFKTVEYGEDLKSGLSTSEQQTVKEVADTVHGHQRDKKGQIWEFLRIPRWQKVETPLGTGYLRALAEDIIENSPSQITLKVLNNQMTVDNQTLRIVNSNQVQQIGTFIPVEDGLMKLEASLKNFDEHGSPLLLVRMSKLIKRVGPYEEIDNLDGLDLKKLFAEYLRNNGKADLVPDADKPAQR